MSMASSLDGSRVSPRVHLDRLRPNGDDKLHLHSLYVEWASDRRPSMNQDRELHRGALENKALQAMKTWAPALFQWAMALKGPADSSPAMAATLARHADAQPLRDVNLIAIQHLLDDNMVGPLTELGLDPRRAYVLGIPYSTNAAVAERLRAQGFDVDDRACRDLPYPVWREMQVGFLIKKALADHAQNGKPILVLDDGGYVASVLQRQFPEQAHLFTIVEQTTHGLRVAEQLEAEGNLPTPVVSIAKADCKQPELAGLERTIGGEVMKRLAPFADPSFLSGRPAVVDLDRLRLACGVAVTPCVLLTSSQRPLSLGPRHAPSTQVNGAIHRTNLRIQVPLLPTTHRFLCRRKRYRLSYSSHKLGGLHSLGSQCNCHSGATGKN